MTQTIIVRVHENRVMYDWKGYLQWRPAAGKKTQWYTVHKDNIEPLGMRDRLQHVITEEMIPYQVAYEVKGEWSKEKKTMTIESLVGPVG